MKGDLLHGASPGAAKILEALGLDNKGVTAVTLDIAAGKIASIKVTFEAEVWVNDIKTLVSTLKKYELIEVKP